jgi:hypothetical protein
VWCSLWGTDWIFKYYFDKLWLQRFNVIYFKHCNTSLEDTIKILRIPRRSFESVTSIKPMWLLAYHFWLTLLNFVPILLMWNYLRIPWLILIIRNIGICHCCDASANILTFTLIWFKFVTLETNMFCGISSFNLSKRTKGECIRWK